MNTLIIVGSILAVLAIIGSILPAMPGPLLSFISLLLLYFAKGTETISILTLVIFGIAMVLLALMDYLGPILGAKFSGSTKKGIWGAVIGAFLGIIFFPPFGIFLGALLGAVLGEMASGKKFDQAIKAGIGVLLGSFLTIFLQTVFSVVTAVYFFWKIF